MGSKAPRYIAIVLFGIVVNFGPAQGADKLPEIWLAPLQPVQRSNGALAGSVDYSDLFSPDAPWATVSQHVSVFKIYPDLLRRASDDELRRMIAGLAARHIALALETPILLPCNGAPGVGEKQTPWMVKLIGRLKQLGGDLRYLAMVGPLVDGHTFGILPGCSRAIPDVAVAAAKTVALVRQLYPSIQVGEIEPTGQGSRYPDWKELSDWFDAWQKADGQPLTFLHMDTQWGANWKPDIQYLAEQTRRRGVKFGVIYDGNERDLSDAAFARTALAHADAVEELLRGPPDQVLFQSWVTYPRHSLPETTSSAMTGIARDYLRPRSYMVVNGGKLHLQDQGGSPIANADLDLREHNVSWGSTLEDQSIDGIVPHDVLAASIALRIHTECFCVRAATSLALAEFQFRQDETFKSNFDWNFHSWGNRRSPASSENYVGGQAAQSIRSPPDQKVILNGPVFPVTPDQTFSAHFAWQVEPEASDTGYVALIFLGRDGIEKRRVTHFLKTSWLTFAHLKTDSTGSASLTGLPDGKGISFQLVYYGDSEHRPAVLDIAP
jgi:hypothetical protein